MRKKRRLFSYPVALFLLVILAIVVFISLSVLKFLDQRENSDKTTEPYIYPTIAQEQTTARITTLDNAAAGDTVYFGNYEQDNDLANGKEKLAWKVLAVENQNALLISEKILDCRPVDLSESPVTWETCSLRSWLNGEFFEGTFTMKEISAIKTTTVNASMDEDGKVFPGRNNTEDKVFLLSSKQAEEYFKSDNARQAQGTDYAVSKGLLVYAEDSLTMNGNWWAMSPGAVPLDAGYISYQGEITEYRAGALTAYPGVRPVLWANISE